MTTNIAVGPNADLKNGIAWHVEAFRRHLLKPADDSYGVDVNIRVDPGAYKDRLKYVNDTWWFAQWMRSIVLDGSGADGVKTIISNEPAPGTSGLPSIHRSRLSISMNAGVSE